MTYQDLVPVGTLLIVGATCFALGAIYGNLPYDARTLWGRQIEDSFFQDSLKHYSIWATTPNYVHYILHGVLALGFLGCFIKLYKPSDDTKYFEYGSLALFLVAVLIYLTNLRTGLGSVLTGAWGEVDMKTGINVMAASQFMIFLLLLGVLVFQCGLYYALWYEKKIQTAYLNAQEQNEESPNDLQPTGDNEDSTASVSGSLTKRTKKSTKKRN